MRTRTKRAVFFFGVMVCVLLALYAVFLYRAAGATYTWDGGGGTNSWTECANWSSDTCPGSSDIAYFDGTCVTNCSPSVQTNFSVAGLTMASGYTGTITVATSSPTIGSSGFSQAAGTFQGGTGTTTFYKSFTRTGGTYNAASTTYFAIPTDVGAAVIDVPTSQTFERLLLSRVGGSNSLSIATGDTLIVTGLTRFVAGEISGGTIDARGDIQTDSGYAQTGSTVVDFGNDSLAQTWTVNGGTSPIVRFDSAADASDSIVLTTNAGFRGASTTASFSGTIPFASNNYTMTIGVDGWQQAAGTFQGGTGTTTFSKSFTLTGGTYNAASTTYFLILTDVGAAVIDVPTSQTFSSLVISRTGGTNSLTISTGDTLIVTGLLRFMTGSGLTGGTIDARGNIQTDSGLAQTGTTIVDFGNDSLAQTWTVNGGTSPIVRFDSAADASDSIVLTADAGFRGASTTASFSGTIPFAPNNYTMTIGLDGWQQAAGTFQGGTGTTTFSKNFTLTGGTYNAASTTYIAVTDGAGTAAFDVPTSQTFDRLFISRTGGSNSISIATGDTLIATGLLRFVAGSIGGGTIDARGDIQTDSGFNQSSSGSTIIDFGNDSLAQTWTVNGGTSPIVRFDSAADASDSIVLTTNAGFRGASTTASFSGTIPFAPNNYTMTIGWDGWQQAAGTFQGGTGTTTHTYSFTLTGGTYNAASTTYIAITDSAGGVTIDVPTSATFSSLLISRTGGSNSLSIATGDTLIVTDLLRFVAGGISGGTIEARGRVVVDTAYTLGTTDLTFSGSSTSGTANQTFDLTGATGNFNADITINKSEGTVTLLSALVMDAASQDLTITSGKLDIAGNNLTVSGSGGTFVVAASGTLALQGGETVSTPTLRHGSTIEYNGSSTYTSLKIATTTYSNLTISGSGTWSTSTALTITGNFTQTAGTFTQTGATTTFSGATSTTLTTSSGTTFGHVAFAKTSATTTLAGSGLSTTNILLSGGGLDASTAGCSSSSCNITVAGTWVKTSGTFVPRSGTVTLSGTNQSISGSNSFYNLTKTVSASSTLTYEAGSTQTVTGAWTMRGQSGANLSLRSSSGGSYWYVDPQGARSLAYVDIQDGNNANALVVNASATGNVDSGHNVNFGFNPGDFLGRIIRIGGGTRFGGGVRL